MMGKTEQRGSALITAIFLITALAVLGAMVSRTMITKSDESVSEFLSTQALYAAETGVQWAARDIVAGGIGTTGALPANVAGTTTFTTNAVATSFGGKTVYTITSTGAAQGGMTPVRRTIEVSFAP